ncbi:MAG: site-2 protease family protein, partial [Thermoproteus sp.]|nr:site-2 protease family protein [Thermoproteus sp.]
KDLVKGFVLIMWSSEKLAELIRRVSEKLSFVPLRAYLAMAAALFLLSAYSPYFPIPAGVSISYMPGFIYILVGSTYQALYGLFRGAPIQEVAVVGGQAGAVPLLPGITIPWDQLPYIAVAVAVGVALHEFMHGYAAVRHKIKLKSAGVFSAFFIASGAFVEPDEEELKRSSLSAKTAVLVSGVAANVALALIALAVYIAGVHLGLGGAVLSSVNPQTAQLGFAEGDVITAVSGCGVNTMIVVPDQLAYALNRLVGNPYGLPKCSLNDTISFTVVRNGRTAKVEIPASRLMDGAPLLGLIYDGPLYRAGLRPGDKVVKLYGCGGVYPIYSGGQFLYTLHVIETGLLCRPGDTVIATAERDGALFNFTVTLGANPDNASRPFFGIYANQVGQMGYNTDIFNINLFTNTFFIKFIMWFYLINIGLAMINALPIYPLDGGLLLAAFLERAVGERRGRAAAYAVSLVLASLIAFSSALGFVSGLYKQVFQLLR